LSLFFASLKKIKKHQSGIDVDRKDNPGARWKNMAMIPGTVKMVKDAAGIMHVIVYVGFKSSILSY
jgi:hypothetical protein